MKNLALSLSILLAAVLLAGCSLPLNFVKNTNAITPSDVIISEERSVSGFTSVDMRSIGKVNLTQGDREALTITGSDNLLPLIKTSVRDGILIIKMKENISLTRLDDDNMLTFDLTVKDLTGLFVSGLGDVEMGALDTSSLKVIMSGAGMFKLSNLTAESLDTNVSGLGNVEIAGKVTRQDVEISGAGEVKNGDLECQTANIHIPGLGSATVWATDRLTGSISGAGSAHYYGNPETNTNSNGLGRFQSLGSK